MVNITNPLTHDYGDFQRSRELIAAVKKITPHHHKDNDTFKAKPLTLVHLFATTGNEQEDSFYNFLGLCGILTVLTIITFFIWKKWLFERFGAYIPIDKNLDVQQINKRKVFMSTKTYSVFK